MRDCAPHNCATYGIRSNRIHPRARQVACGHCTHSRSGSSTRESRVADSNRDAAGSDAARNIQRPALGVPTLTAGGDGVSYVSRLVQQALVDVLGEIAVLQIRPKGGASTV